jgi:hypothetical protein
MKLFFKKVFDMIIKNRETEAETSRIAVPNLHQNILLSVLCSSQCAASGNVCVPAHDWFGVRANTRHCCALSYTEYLFYYLTSVVEASMLCFMISFCGKASFLYSYDNSTSYLGYLMETSLYESIHIYYKHRSLPHIGARYNRFCLGNALGDYHRYILVDLIKILEVPVI